MPPPFKIQLSRVAPCAEEEEEAKEMNAEEFVAFLISKWGSEALHRAETLLAGAKKMGAAA